MNTVRTGHDQISEGYWEQLKGYRLGLLANQASLDRRLNTAKDIIVSLLPGQLKALFGPQHGYGGEKQDNMVESNHFTDKALSIPVFSLYSETREPIPHMLEMIDILIIDLQDVGTRVYTFASTVLNCLKAASRDIPMRHGFTMGEMAQMFNHVFDLACDLEVIPMHGWHRDMLWNETGLKSFMPSTNMPSALTAAVYPGQVIWEGTNLSEGRGTCRPFEIFGAPYLDTKAVKNELEPEAVEGCYLQEYSFQPTFNKWQGELCHGFMIHIVDPKSYQPYFTSLSILKAVMEIHQTKFEWKEPPYEYEYKKKPIDLIIGDSSIRRELESGVRVSRIRKKWQPDLESFFQWRRRYLLYS